MLGYNLIKYIDTSIVTPSWKNTIPAGNSSHEQDISIGYSIQISGIHWSSSTLYHCYITMCMLYSVATTQLDFTV